MLYELRIKQSMGCEFVLSVIDHRAFILSKYFSYFLNSISHFQFLTINTPDLLNLLMKFADDKVADDKAHKIILELFIFEFL